MNKTFLELFGRSMTASGSAHGRVNLIGEHTDYNEGFVLPTPIPQRTIAEVAPHEDGAVETYSGNFPGDGVMTYSVGKEREQGSDDWRKYVKGVTVLLAKEGFTLPGFSLRVASTVPVGSGLSSSAALEVAVLRALRSAFCLPLDDEAVARLGQRVENEFVGAHVGIMDQMSASVGERGSALFLDARDLSYERIPLPQDADLLVINSGVEHEHAGGDYNTRRTECEQACKLLGVRSLRDVGVGDLPRIDALPAPFGRRAKHIVTENQRVLDAVAAMRVGDLEQLGKLFSESHASQRDDFAVSIAEIDLLVDLASREPDVYGARLTGGGFGGSIVALTKSGVGRATGERIVAEYGRRTGKEAVILVPEG